MFSNITLIFDARLHVLCWFLDDWCFRIGYSMISAAEENGDISPGKVSQLTTTTHEIHVLACI